MEHVRQKARGKGLQSDHNGSMCRQEWERSEARMELINRKFWAMRQLGEFKEQTLYVSYGYLYVLT